MAIYLFIMILCVVFMVVFMYLWWSSIYS